MAVKPNSDNGATKASIKHLLTKMDMSRQNSYTPEDIDSPRKSARPERAHRYTRIIFSILFLSFISLGMYFAPKWFKLQVDFLGKVSPAEMITSLGFFSPLILLVFLVCVRLLFIKAYYVGNIQISRNFFFQIKQHFRDLLPKTTTISTTRLLLVVVALVLFGTLGIGFSLKPSWWSWCMIALIYIQLEVYRAIMYGIYRYFWPKKYVEDPLWAHKRFG